jgi:DNA invertase Pin-like site-specific DNA recombinase
MSSAVFMKSSPQCDFVKLGVFAEFETAIRRERQLEGIAAAKVKRVYTGRKPSIAADEVRRLAASGMGGTAIARELKISRASVYRLLNGGEA